MSAQLRELVDERTVLLPLTVDQYHQMIDRGIVPEGEPYELLDGYVVRKDRSAAGDDPMTIGDEHAWAVMKLVRLAPKFDRLGCHLRPQLAVELPPYNRPEPDG